MARTNILLQTTIPYTADDWHIGRFSLLRDWLASLDHVTVTARDRDADATGDDRLLPSLAESGFDQLWLFAVDTGEGLTKADCAGITAFARRGGAILATRDHHDLGSSICNLGGVGAAHFFHTRNVDPDPSRRTRDDEATTSIDWPNYHSGRNGDYQRIAATRSHPLMQRADGTPLEWFPAHPHEGAVGVPEKNGAARVIATGTSKVTQRPFNLIVAMEANETHGRALAHSSFHHFCDYNWDIARGCPSFVEEAPGDEIARDPRRLDDVRTYVANAVRWLQGSP
ncbi:MAG TPA: hypothetical protein VGF28_12335 [Thermoanaerobaculia bacterium]